MVLYPVFLKIKDRRCLVIGGGSVAERKVKSLIESGARVTVVSPDLTGSLQALSDRGLMEHTKRNYREGDLEGFFLAVAATSDKEVNRRIYSEAEKSGVLINSVDDPENCSFFVPSTVRRGDFQVAISTSGKAPYLAKKVRLFLENLFYKDLGTDLENLSRLRSGIIEESGGNAALKEKKLRLLLKPEAENILRKIEKK
jgi:precorrin-2 dehydrogenase/sirohydrochlorin ferrochelatase